MELVYHVASMTEGAPWSEAILAGLVLQVLGMMLMSFIAPGGMGFVLSFGFLGAGLAVSRRSPLRLRDFLAYLVLTLASLSAIFNLVGAVAGTSTIYDAGGAPAVIGSILAALVAGIALLTALRRSERVPYFG